MRPYFKMVEPVSHGIFLPRFTVERSDDKPSPAKGGYQQLRSDGKRGGDAVGEQRTSGQRSGIRCGKHGDKYRKTEGTAQLVLTFTRPEAAPASRCFDPIMLEAVSGLSA